MKMDEPTVIIIIQLELCLWCNG